MNYWLDLFTGTTWDEFKKHGATVSGFRYRRRKLACKIKYIRPEFIDEIAVS